MRVVTCLVAAGFVLAAACGGSDGTTLFVAADGGGGGNDGSSNTGPDGSSNPADSGGVTILPDGAIVGPDGAILPTSDAGLATTIACGAMLTCNLGTEQCCVTPGGGGGNPAPPKYSCAAVCPQNATALKCGSAADCGLDVCCVSATNPTSSSCKPQCAANEAMLCDPNGSAQANRCGDAGTCSSNNIRDWNLPPSYGTCGGLPN